MNRVILDERTWQDLLVRRSARDVGPPQVEAEGLELYSEAAARRDQSFIIGQVGQSLDGRVATASGDSQDVSGREGLKHLHRLRALADAVIVGVGTVLHDDPRLTVRYVSGRDPARVIIDPSGRVPNSARILQDDGARRIVVQDRAIPRPTGVEIIRIERTNAFIHPSAIVSALAERGLHHLLVEGGARTLANFLTAGLLHRLHIAVAPLIIGDGPPGLSLPPVPLLRNCLRPKIKLYDLGGEYIFDCALDPDCVRPAAEVWNGSANRS